jgi:hypothetical protein
VGKSDLPGRRCQEEGARKKAPGLKVGLKVPTSWWRNRLAPVPRSPTTILELNRCELTQKNHPTAAARRRSPAYANHWWSMLSAVQTAQNSAICAPT